MDDDVPFMTSEEARETFDLGASSPVIAARASWTPQTREWDCALACASCVLGRRARDAARRRRSTWTIDLAGIFTAAGARRVMLVTRTIGVDPRLAEDAFYEEDYLRDVARVNAAFRRATALDSPVRVVRRRVRAGDIAAIVLNGAHACVALVDRCGLSPTETTSEGFEGHYVVVEDANVDAKTFALIDPAGDARTKGRKIVTWSCFDDARRAFGTDEDLLFVSLRAKDFNVDAPRRFA